MIRFKEIELPGCEGEVAYPTKAAAHGSIGDPC